MRKTIAVITARGGSKRIPRKNIKLFCGQPMIKYAIDAAHESKAFDRVMVSTDDEEIAQIALKYNAEVPFMRSAETSSDFATTVDVLQEVVLQYKRINVEFDSLCCIYPCVPFLKSDILVKAYDAFIKKDTDMLMPVVKFSHPIQRALYTDETGFLKYAHPEFEPTRTQDMEPMYYDAGMFYFYKVKSLSTQNKKMYHYEIKETETQDIDTEDDWKYAEIKYSLLNSTNNDTSSSQKESMAKAFLSNKLLYPNERVVAFLAKNYGEVEKNSSLAALDIGCGSGRHINLLMDYGMQAFGVDHTEEACKRSSAILLNRGVGRPADRIYYGDFYNHYDNNSFDVVICLGAIFYRQIELMQKNLIDIYRIMKKGGRMIIDFRTDEDSLYGKGKRIDENSFFLDESSGPYKSILYTFLSLDKAKELLLLAGFDIESIERVELWKDKLVNRHTWFLFTVRKI